MTPIITRYRRRLDISYIAIVVVLQLFFMGSWYCRGWTQRVLGYDIFLMIQAQSTSLAMIGPIVAILGLGSHTVFCLWVRREKKAFSNPLDPKRPCLYCLYDQRGTEASRCPECGESITIPEIEDYFEHLSNTGRWTRRKRVRRRPNPAT